MLELETYLNGNGPYHAKNPDRPIEDPVETHLAAIYEISIAGMPPLLRERQIQAFMSRLRQAALNVQNKTGYPTYDAFNFTADVCPEQPISCGRFTYFPEEHVVESPYYPSQRIKLTPIEGGFFRIVITNGGYTVPYHEILNSVYGEGRGHIRALKVHASHIRSKIGGGRKHLRAHNGTGYLFQD